MSKIINIVLVLITLVLGFWLYSSIKDPIEFNQELERRKFEVIAKLKKIQTAQDIYRAVTGKYAKSFDDLVTQIQNGNIEVVSFC